MPTTINKNTNQSQIIAGTFSNKDNADKAVQAFRERGVPDSNIQVVVQLTENQAAEAYRDALVGRGFTESQALFYDKAVQNGKVLVAVHNVTDPAEIIEIFDDNKAEYNPDGSRNVREDVAGMTVGAGVGAVAGGIAGAAVAGPLGAAVGAAAGAVVGGGAGAAAGKASEHSK
jgi:hypothetical protein